MLRLPIICIERRKIVLGVYTFDDGGSNTLITIIDKLNTSIEEVIDSL